MNIVLAPFDVNFTFPLCAKLINSIDPARAYRESVCRMEDRKIKRTAGDDSGLVMAQSAQGAAIDNPSTAPWTPNCSLRYLCGKSPV